MHKSGVGLSFGITTAGTSCAESGQGWQTLLAVLECAVRDQTLPLVFCAVEKKNPAIQIHPGLYIKT